MEKKIKEQLDRAWQDPAGAATAWKAKTSGKAIGLCHTDVPEELVHAAGALPMTIMARDIAIQKADKHLQSFACTYSRSVVELYEQGELGYLDGIIMPYACDTTRCLDLVFKFAAGLAFYDCLRIPKRVSAEGVKKYFRAELERLAQNLSAFTGQEITNARLGASIKQFNRVRLLLARLQEAVRDRAISASDYFSAVRAALVLPPEDSETLLKQAAETMGGAKANGKGPRVIVAGKVPQPPGIIGVIEKAGLLIVEDHLVVGGRWVAAMAPEGTEPWDALIERQLNRLPFAGIWDRRPSRSAYLQERVKAMGANAVVFLVQKFCEPAELDYPGIKEELTKAGVPMLVLDSDYSPGSLDGLKTRVEAFAEMLKK